MKLFDVRIVAGLPVLWTLVGVPVASAQTAEPPVGVFVTGNIGMMQPMPNGLTSIASVTDGFNRDDVRLMATMKRSPVVDMGGGVIFRGRWMLGAAFDRSAESMPAEIAVTLQHPDFHPTLTASRETEDLKRVDSGLHVSAGYRIPINRSLSLTVFGGPSYLTRQQEMLNGIHLSEPFDLRTRTFSATIDSFDMKTIRSSAWGYHVGADASYFMSRHVGIGGQLRYARATFNTENLLQSNMDERTVTDLTKGGGLRFAAGIRLRF